ncbi:MAG: class I SAM-dependent methyltransferase [Iamia sp.]
MPDAIFEDPRLAAIYDIVDDDRSDLDAYLDLVDELGAASVLDVGCGTGTFACRLAARGTQMTGVDPAAASLEVARGKPFADRVRWVEADASNLPAIQVDLVTMTGNVAQVFLTDRQWLSALRGIRAVLAPGGYLVFETRRPERRAWEGWTEAETRREIHDPSVGTIVTWVETSVTRPPFISFRHTFEFERDGVVLTSTSVLCFREEDEIVRQLHQAGLRAVEVRDAPDRPGLEHVFVAAAI